MKTKCLLMCLIFVVCTAQVQARPDHKIYLPLFIFPKMDGTMGLWSYVEPEVAINLITNSSFETNTAGWLGSGNNTIARTSDQQKFGVYALECTQGEVASLVMAQYAITFPVAGTYTLSAWVYLTPTWDAGAVSLRFRNFAGSTIVTASTSVSATGNWTRIALTVAVVGGDLVGNLDVILSVAAGNSEIAYVDAVDCVLSPYATTHVDGDQPGCEWNGAEHASTSTRSALSRAGGRVINFDDLNFDISGMFGAGMSPITVNVDPFAILPGAEINSIKTDERTFTLSGWVTGESLEDLHANRQAIIDALKPNAVPGNQPVLLRYTGAVLTKEIAATYEAGLAGTIRGEFPCLEQNFTLRFLAADPNWYEIGNSAAVLDTNDTFTVRNVIAHLRMTNQWDDLGPPAVPGGGTPANYAGTLAVEVGLDGIVYYGGQFDNFDNQPNADRIVQYDPVTDTYSPLGTGMNGNVEALARAPNGDIYAGGSFPSAGGVPNTFRIARWDVSAGVWVPLGAGLNNTVRALTFGLDGRLYIGGSFTDIQGGPGGTYNRIVVWDPVAGSYSALGTGLNSICQALATDINGDIIAAGDFTTAGGNANVRVARWVIVSSTWPANSFGAGVNATANAVIVDSIGTIYVGGQFLTADGQAILRITFWNGVTFVSMGDADAIVSALEIAPNGLLYAGGAFSVIGGLATVDGAAIWNGSVWIHLDVNFPAISVTAFAFGIPNPVINDNYDVWVAISGVGTATYAGLIAVINDGTEDAFPQIAIERVGGTSARLLQITNEILGLKLWFDYSLIPDEILTIDLTPTTKSIVSNFFGQRLDALLPNSAFGDWRLQSGDNDITAFVDVVGAPTIIGTLEFRDPYWASD